METIIKCYYPNSVQLNIYDVYLEGLLHAFVLMKRPVEDLPFLLQFTISHILACHSILHLCHLMFDCASQPGQVPVHRQ